MSREQLRVRQGAGHLARCKRRRAAALPRRDTAPLIMNSRQEVKSKVRVGKGRVVRET